LKLLVWHQADIPARFHFGRNPRVAPIFCLAQTGWNRKEQPRIENVVATMYSALGIDWSKEIRNTPSGRTYAYVDPLGPNGYIPTDEISAIYS